MENFNAMKLPVSKRFQREQISKLYLSRRFSACTCISYAWEDCLRGLTNICRMFCRFLYSWGAFTKVFRKWSLGITLKASFTNKQYFSFCFHDWVGAIIPYQYTVRLQHWHRFFYLLDSFVNNNKYVKVILSI